jgi:hypothetical protein
LTAIDRHRRHLPFLFYQLFNAGFGPVFGLAVKVPDLCRRKF